MANTPGAALGDGKKPVHRFMAGNPKLRPGADPQKFSRCRSRSGDEADPLESMV